MKQILYILTLLVIMTPIALLGQPTVPRTLFVRLVEVDGSSVVDDTTGFAFEATMNGVTRNHEFPGFGFVHGNGNMYVRIQLGNFGVEWLPGDKVDIFIHRDYPLAIAEPLSITIPEGSSAIWWGAPVWEDREFPGAPARLCPVNLHVTSTPSQDYQILKDGKPIGNTTNAIYKPESLSELTGVFTLEQPPSGFHWEPSQYDVTIRDFRFAIDPQASKIPAYNHSVEFKLINNNH